MFPHFLDFRLPLLFPHVPTLSWPSTFIDVDGLFPSRILFSRKKDGGHAGGPWKIWKRRMCRES
eukprot:8223561-Pyramimonas_sp.AAC.1